MNTQIKELEIFKKYTGVILRYNKFTSVEIMFNFLNFIGFKK